LKRHLLIFCFVLLRHSAYTQGHKPTSPEYDVHPIHQAIELDGNDLDSAWQGIEYSTPYWEFYPLDTGYSSQTTQFKMAVDENNFYILVKCYSSGTKFVTPSLRRDFRAGGSDNITFLLDPNGDRTTAYFFGINPYGVMREGLVANGGADVKDFTVSWDNKWKAASTIYKKYWIAEMVIPFKTLRYNKNIKSWRMNSYRFDTQSQSTMTWSHIPRNQRIYGLAFMGLIHFEQNLPDPGSNISLIPYALANRNREYITQTKSKISGIIGGDIKIGLTPGMNLDLTANPDFSQVEVDQQVTNLTRFEISLPETRQFFQENADLFANFGNDNIRPFFSRRIGISFDTLTHTNVLNTIIGGARLSGKLTPNLRTGLLNMITAGDKSNGLPTYNYSILSLQRSLYSRSNISMQLINKQTFDSRYSDQLYDRYNRVIALEYNLASSNNEWTGKAFYQRSFSPTQEKSPQTIGTQLILSKKTYRLSWDQEYVGEGYNAQVGFVPRKNYFRINPHAGLVYLPAKGIFATHGPFIAANLIWTPGLGKTDHSFDIGWEGTMRNVLPFSVSFSHEYTYLFADYSPSGKGLSLIKGSSYQYINFKADIGSDRRKVISSEFLAQIGQFYNGTIISFTSLFNMRYRKYLTLTGTFNYNKIQMPAPYSSNNIWLIGPRIDLTMTRNFFLTGFFQYNSLANNININARMQWRYAPVSDFYIVYTDNYYSDNFKIKNRAIVAKLTYWLNM
jgi:Domain of unknown function (DUF5916)